MGGRPDLSKLDIVALRRLAAIEERAADPVPWYAEELQKRREALDEITRISEELGLYDE